MPKTSASLKGKIEINELIPEYFAKFFIRAINFSKFNGRQKHFSSYRSHAPREMARDYICVTGEKIVSSSAETIKNYPDFYNHMKREKYRNLINIGNMYKSVVPILFWISLIAHLVLPGAGFLKKQLRFDAVMGPVILGGWFH